MPKALIETFGCQMNVHDSEVLAGLLDSCGYTRAASAAEADLILLNTCCVREHAEQRVLGHLGNLKLLKAARPELIIGVCGCMVQQPAAVAKLQTSYPQVDLIFGTHNLPELPELLAQLTRAHAPVVAVRDEAAAIHEGLPVVRTDPFRALVNIMYGCNNFCSYCIVPYVRGRERSRQPEAIRAEVQQLAQEGVREVTLLGQNVNSYGQDLTGSGWNFGRLLAALAQESGIGRLRFQTSHPKDLSPALLEVLAGHSQICRQLHLPVQAGSSRILALMNRGYSKEDYLKLTALIREVLPDWALTTDLLVGFPGESEADFQETLDLVTRARFDAAFTFSYSSRSGTAAADFPDPVPEPEKRQRLQRLNTLQNQISWECNQAWLNREAELLVEGPSSKDPATWSGRTSQNKLVHFVPSPGLAPGALVNCRITTAGSFALRGELLV